MSENPSQSLNISGGQLSSHTHSIVKYGLETVLPESIELIHGPGCPVCVMLRGRLDDAIALAKVWKKMLFLIIYATKLFMLKL